jgi:signal transduction histidine kinase
VNPSEKPLRVLVVDDDELDRLAVRRCLRRMGIQFRVDEARSAATTRERLGDASYDCILLDYYLPGEDSLELLRDLRATTPDTPVVIFTGRGDEDVAVELMKSGAADYLPKASLTPERLAAALRHAREVTRAAAARRRAESLLRLSSDAARHLLSAGTPDELVRGLFEVLREPLGLDAWFSYLPRAGSHLRLGSYGGLPDQAVLPVLELQFDRSRVAKAARQLEAEIVQKVGPPNVRACSCQPLLDQNELLGLLCFASGRKVAFGEDERDFLGTVSQYAAAALVRLRHIEEMRGSERRKDEFLAMLAHELRDPLAPLSNVLELMKLANGSGDILEQARQTMERQLAQLVQLVDDLLDISRITRSRLELRKRRVDLQSVVHHAVETARPLAESLGHRLSVALPGEPVYLDADPVRLAQVFGNLLTNACKYTESAGDITLFAERTGADVEVRVRDSGIGIPPGELTTVFDLFSQSASASQFSHGGLGIGLTLVKRLVAMHGGTVEARSEGPGAGSEFVVRLPVPGEATTSPAPAEAIAAAPTVAERRILIVDDNKDSAASLAMLLEMAGNTVREAHDGLAAVEAAEEFRPDLMLLDIGLPKLDGLEVCRRIRSMPWGRDVRIVALSGWGQDADRRKSREAGFDHHLLKPVNYPDLARLLNAFDAPRQPEEGGADARG